MQQQMKYLYLPEDGWNNRHQMVAALNNLAVFHMVAAAEIPPAVGIVAEEWENHQNCSEDIPDQSDS